MATEFRWTIGTRRLVATVRPPGFAYRHHHHRGHTCRVPTLEVRDRSGVQMSLPVSALEDIDTEHALAEFFGDAGVWFGFLAWVYGQDPEPIIHVQETGGGTGAQPVLTPKDEKLLKGQGLKFQNRGLVDQDYSHRLIDAVRAWLARFIDHAVENRWRYDGQDLVKPGSPLARQLYQEAEARKRAMRILPDRPLQAEDCFYQPPELSSGNPEVALIEWADARRLAETQELTQVEAWLRSKRRRAG